MHLTRKRGGHLLLGIYLASVALVCSFILFEVLDIDGSDFPPPSASVEARPVEPHLDDLKKAILIVGARGIVGSRSRAGAGFAG